MSCTVYRQPETPGRPTMFALVQPGRLVELILHYEALRVDAEHLPAAPHRLPLPYVERVLAELRRELVAREYGTVGA